MPGEQIWLSYINFPLGVSYFQLDVNNTTGMRATDLTLKENKIIARDKPEAPCRSYILEVKVEKVWYLSIPLLKKHKSKMK